MGSRPSSIVRFTSPTSLRSKTNVPGVGKTANAKDVGFACIDENRGSAETDVVKARLATGASRSEADGQGVRFELDKITAIGSSGCYSPEFPCLSGPPVTKFAMADARDRQSTEENLSSGLNFRLVWW